MNIIQVHDGIWKPVEKNPPRAFFINCPSGWEVSDKLNGSIQFGQKFAI
jgi:hypothetical protein